MANIVIMPKLGATMDEGRIIRWFVKEGGSVSKGAPLLEVESDKATLEVESPTEGTLLKILHHDGDIPVLQPIGVIGTPGEDISGLAELGGHGGLADGAEEPEKSEEFGAATAGKTGEGGISKAGEAGISKAGEAGISEAGKAGISEAGKTGISKGGEGGISEAGKDGISEAGEGGIYESGKFDEGGISDERMKPGASIKSTPGAKRIAKENNIDLKYVTPGKNGIITGSEVEQYIKTAAVKATPVAARIAEINNVPLARVEHDGRKICKADVLSHLAVQDAEKHAAERHAALNSEAGVGMKSGAGIQAEGDTQVEGGMYAGVRVQARGGMQTEGDMQAGVRMQKMGNVRRKTAERMTKTWQTVPMATNAVEVDASNALSLCERVNIKTSGSGFKINLTDLLLKVLAAAVARNPEVNAFIDGEMIVYRNEVNVSFAVALDNGLVVPVIRNADRMGLMQINNAKRELASKAKAGKLAIDEMNGGSITLTNMGSFGEGIFFPIINAPELCIVGTGKVTKKPVVVGGEITIKPMMWVTLTFDHRVIDGVPAAKLLSEIKDMIETPELLMHF